MDQVVDEVFLDAEGVARLCHVEPDTVRKVWRYKKGFPTAYRPGKALLWERSAIVAWVKRHPDADSAEPGGD